MRAIRRRSRHPKGSRSAVELLLAMADGTAYLVWRQYIEFVQRPDCGGWRQITSDITN